MKDTFKQLDLVIISVWYRERERESGYPAALSVLYIIALKCAVNVQGNIAVDHFLTENH